MPPAPRPAILFLLLTYLALSALPFVPLLLGKPVEHAWQILGIEVVAWLAVWSMFGRPARFHWLLLPAFLALPTELYLYIYYGQGISTHHLGIIAETSPKEAAEFLGGAVWLMVAVLLGVGAWWAATFRIARRVRQLDWSDSSRWVALAALLLGAIVWGYGKEFGIEGRKPVASASTPDADKAVAGAGLTGWKLRPLPHQLKLPVHTDAFVRSWPFGLVARGVDFYKERKQLAALGERNSAFRFDARQDGADGKPEVVVMVIGESARFDRWSLNGYERDTNPLLRKETNLVMLTDVITAVSATRLSVPVMLTRKPATQSLKAGFAEKSFLTAYREAGFKTYWLSNQVSFGEFDTPVSVFAREAEVIQFLNLGGFTNHSNLDEILLDPLRIALADPAPRKLVVLHTLGSHWNYSHRYPAQFDRWKPSLFGVDKPVYTDPGIKAQLNNSYDNSILYTDWFLAQIIGALKQSGQRSSLMYVADHGQTLYDKSCQFAFHGHNHKVEFHVPAFVWYSDAYAAHRPDKITQLRRHRDARLATENVFHSLLDLADIRYPDERLERSFFSSQLKPHKRYVDSYGWADYDNATFRGDCGEVIDKGKPLKRE